MTLRGTAPAAAPVVVEKRPGMRALAMAVVAGLSTFDPALTIGIGPWVAIAVFALGRPLRLQVTAPIILALTFAFWVFASQAWTAFPEMTKATAVLWAQLLVMFVAIYDLLKTRAHVRLVAYGYVVGGVVTVARNIFADPNNAQVAVVAGGRAELGNANVNYVAYALSAGFALVLLLWVTRRRTKSAVLGLGAAVTFIVIGVNISDTRGALLGLALLLGWVIFSVVFRRPPLVAAVVSLLMVALGIITGVVDQASLALESGVRATGDWSGRLVIWPWAREIWAADPLIGVGAGGFGQMNPYGVLAHNIFLQTGTGLGIIGVLILLALIWSALVWKRTADRQPKRALLVGAFLLASAPAYMSGVWETAPASWIVLAIFSRLDVLAMDAPDTDTPAPVPTRVKKRPAPDWANRPAGRKLVEPPAGKHLPPILNA